MKILYYIFLITFVYFMISPKLVFTKEQTDLNQFVTIVNPVRISSYTKDPKAALTSQYSEVNKRSLPATWLLTYDAILNPGIISVITTMDEFQELGVFLEITPKLAEDAGVLYNKTDSWHRANSIFLSGYVQADRINLIDAIFEKFKKAFGYYPKSIGAWWVDSYSLEYMQTKYGITSNLTVADQFEADGYQVWGQYFSTPFYPSRYHSGIPARTIENKLDVVMLQWASRDPLYGYGSGPASLYSTQDYFTINLTDEYFTKLINLYAAKHKNIFGQITIGLEGDFLPQTYTGHFARWMEIVKQMREEDKIKVTTMEQFSGWYRNKFPVLSPAHLIETDDLRGENYKILWYQSPAYRIGLIYDYKNKDSKVIDFRTYHSDFEESYRISPNRDLNLTINIPSIIDSVSNPEEAWIVHKGEFANLASDQQKMILKYTDGSEISLFESSISFSGKIANIPKNIIGSKLLNIKKIDGVTTITPKTSWVYSQQGLIFRALTQEATFFLKQKKIILVQILVVLISLGLVIFILKKKISIPIKGSLIGLYFLLIFSTVFWWYRQNSREYFVSQSELDTLFRLALLPGQKIVVYDKVCLQCSWHTKYIPAVFANKRGYVKQVTGKDIIYNSSVFVAETREEGRKNLRRLGADYIYVVRFEDYEEKVPFSPGDLNIEQIYKNANAAVWRIKKS